MGEFGAGNCPLCHSVFSWAEKKVLYQGEVFHLQCLAQKYHLSLGQLEANIDENPVTFKGIKRCFSVKTSLP